MSNNTCVICYEDITTNTNMYVAKCKHEWCQQCHAQMIQFQHHKCPICRRSLKSKKKKRKQKQNIYIYNDIYNETDYEPLYDNISGLKRPWRIKRRLRRAMRALLTIHLK